MLNTCSLNELINGTVVRDDAGEVGEGRSCGAFIILVKELGLNPKDNGKPLKSCKWGRNMTDLCFRRSSMAVGWRIKRSSGKDWVTGRTKGPSTEVEGRM